jgi:hypothetical protein
MNPSLAKNEISSSCETEERTNFELEKCENLEGGSEFSSHELCSKIERVSVVVPSIRYLIGKLLFADLQVMKVRPLRLLKLTCGDQGVEM